jgi:hypothetical protein
MKIKVSGFYFHSVAVVLPVQFSVFFMEGLKRLVALSLDSDSTVSK